MNDEVKGVGGRLSLTRCPLKKFCGHPSVHNVGPIQGEYMNLGLLLILTIPVSDKGCIFQDTHCACCRQSLLKIDDRKSVMAFWT